MKDKIPMYKITRNTPSAIWEYSLYQRSVWFGIWIKLGNDISVSRLERVMKELSQGDRYYGADGEPLS